MLCPRVQLRGGDTRVVSRQQWCDALERLQQDIASVPHLIVASLDVSAVLERGALQLSVLCVHGAPLVAPDDRPVAALRCQPCDDDRVSFNALLTHLSAATVDTHVQHLYTLAQWRVALNDNENGCLRMRYGPTSDVVERQQVNACSCNLFYLVPDCCSLMARFTEPTTRAA